MVKAGACGLFLIAFFTLSACQSGPARSQRSAYDESPVEITSDTKTACLLWRKGLGAHISHLSLDPFARALVVSTSAKESLRWLDPKTGKTAWTKTLPQPVKSQAISLDGKLFAGSTYNGKVSVWNAAGKKLWEHDHLARPVLTRNELVVLNDDDSDPFTGFFSYTLAGKRSAMVAISPESGVEPVDLFTSNDHDSVLISLSNDQLSAYAVSGQPRWRAKLDGRIVAAAAQDAFKPVYVLQQRKGSQVLKALRVSNENDVSELWSEELQGRYETIRLAGTKLFLYGNSHHGQAIAGVDAEKGKLLWKHTYAAPANYSSMVFSGGYEPEKIPNYLMIMWFAPPNRPIPEPMPTYMTVAIEDAKEAGQIQLLRLNAKGEADWVAHVKAPDGIYSYAYADEAGLLAVGAGEPGRGVVEMYSTDPKNCTKR